ncbi:MAG TPA: hypothetical protein VJZ76_23440 [Thermoanaerobaculia bacterium]|nr:hypothetical protein [Thermoanaerobaculia bacterium]
MRNFTIYLDEMEERERKHRRRAKLLGAATIIATLMAMRRRPEPPSPKPQPIVIVKTEKVAVPVVGRWPQTVAKIVTVREPRYYKPLSVQWPAIDLPYSGLTRHLCLTPKRLTVIGANDHVTVSNVGDTPLRIRTIGVLPEQSGFSIDAADCANRQLGAGERCTIGIVVRETRSEPMYLLIDDDRGDYDIAEITASPASRASGS